MARLSMLIEECDSGQIETRSETGKYIASFKPTFHSTAANILLM